MNTQFNVVRNSTSYRVNDTRVAKTASRYQSFIVARAFIDSTPTR